MLYREAEWDRCKAEPMVRPYVDGMPLTIRTGRGLIILGPLGTGKSSTAGLIARHAIMAGAVVRWSYVPDLLGELGDINKREHIVQQQTRADLLIWDDFNAQKISAFHMGFLDRITENRYRNRRAMIVTTNLSVAGLRNFEDGARMIDRWRQRCELVGITGESLRQTWKDR